MSVFKKIVLFFLSICILCACVACSNATNNDLSIEETTNEDLGASIAIDRLSNNISYEYTLNDSNMVDELRNFSFDLGGETFLSKGNLNGKDLAISVARSTASKLTVKVFPLNGNEIDNTNDIAFNNDEFNGVFFSLDYIEKAYIFYSKEYNVYILYSETLNSNPDLIDTSLSDKSIVVYDANANEIAYTYVFYYDSNELQSISENKAKEDYNEVYKYMDNFTSYSGEVERELNKFGLDSVFLSSDSIINTTVISRLDPIGKLETQLGAGKGNFSYVSYLEEE